MPPKINTGVFGIPNSIYVPFTQIRDSVKKWLGVKTVYLRDEGFSEELLIGLHKRRAEVTAVPFDDSFLKERVLAEPTPAAYPDHGIDSLNFLICGTGDIAGWFLKRLRHTHINKAIFGKSNPNSNTDEAINSSGKRSQSVKPFNEKNIEGENASGINLVAIKNEADALALVPNADVIFYSLKLSEFEKTLDAHLSALPRHKKPVFILPIKSLDAKAQTALELFKNKLAEYKRLDLLDNIVFMSGYTSANGEQIKQTSAQGSNKPVLNLVGSGRAALARVAWLFEKTKTEKGLVSEDPFSDFQKVTLLHPDCSPDAALYSVETPTQFINCRVEKTFRGVEAEAFGSAMKNPLMISQAEKLTHIVLGALEKGKSDDEVKAIVADANLLQKTLDDAQTLYHLEGFTGYKVSDPVKEDIQYCQRVDLDELLLLFRNLANCFNDFNAKSEEEKLAARNQARDLIAAAFKKPNQPYGSRNHMAGLFLAFQLWALAKGFIAPFELYDPVEGSRVPNAKTTPALKDLITPPEGVPALKVFSNRESTDLSMLKGFPQFIDACTDLLSRWKQLYERVFAKAWEAPVRKEIPRVKSERNLVEFEKAARDYKPVRKGSVMEMKRRQSYGIMLDTVSTPMPTPPEPGPEAEQDYFSYRPPSFRPSVAPVNSFLQDGVTYADMAKQGRDNKVSRKRSGSPTF